MKYLLQIKKFVYTFDGVKWLIDTTPFGVFTRTKTTFLHLFDDYFGIFYIFVILNKNHTQNLI